MKSDIPQYVTSPDPSFGTVLIKPVLIACQPSFCVTERQTRSKYFQFEITVFGPFKKFDKPLSKRQDGKLVPVVHDQLISPHQK